MQNIMRKQISKSELPVGEKMELREMQGRLIVENGNVQSYGSTNIAFEADLSPQTQQRMTMDMAAADDKSDFKPESEDTRESWDSKLQFILATIGYAVGLGNVWRFPYLAQKNGGGAFLIPYFVMLAIEGVPVFYLELAVGQRLRKGAIGVWNLVSSYTGGIGLTSAVVSFNVALYYNTIIAWCMYYFFQSFQSPLPWNECPREFFPNGSSIIVPECEKSSITQYFWYRQTLDVSQDINHPDKFNWKIALCLLVSWILCYLCMIKGIASSGKVVYVTATFPYLVLIIFFFRGITLEGMKDGIVHLFTPNWSKLQDPVVWLEAGTQIFFSLGLAFGGLIAFSSYNPVHNNCLRDAILVSLTNCGTSMFAGIVVFSVLGFKAHMTHKKCIEERDDIFSSFYNGTQFIPSTIPPYIVDKILNKSENMPYDFPDCNLQTELEKSASGTGLAFIAFTEAIIQFPGAPFWSVLFFLMLFTLGIDSQFGTLEGVITSIVDLKLFPNLRKEFLTGGICLLCFFLSLIFAHGAGNYIFTLFDNFSGNFPLLIVALFECIAIAYVYGLKRFSDDIELMTGNRPSYYWLFCWRYLAPITMITILIASFSKIATGDITYEAWDKETATTVTKEWPTWANIVIAILILMAAIWIPLVALLQVFGIRLLPDEEPAWFPAEDLRDFYGVIPHKVTDLEKCLFCIKETEPEDDV
ncbi:sodium-dependent neutral amino acid transporter B(0)AT3-like [Centruroides sculpturatus]|uniref:sodium-dependent neutral amino acid transporter B(0)AT3-like n=1 Tax=Centruroides sculpturatus TaxID=218467 RepID=UPI000C6EB588|nr:sodium-dependent neutral amino acid transporter B(0)AT3-like [Centruroides sculpturatus]